MTLPNFWFGPGRPIAHSLALSDENVFGDQRPAGFGNYEPVRL